MLLESIISIGLTYITNLFKSIVVLILVPFSWLYGAIIWTRNSLYNHGIKKRYVFTKKVISIGNIRVGGTGKTPFIEYLVGFLQQNFSIAVISRGYKRNTSGYRVAHSLDNALTIGDEPYQLYKKFAVTRCTTKIVVAENKLKAAEQILIKYANTNILLLDDGFQYRKIQPQLNIILTSFHKPFFRDFLLPLGRLREPRKAAKRADIIIVTKCPSILTDTIRNYFKKNLIAYCNNKKTPIFFTTIKYASPKSLWSNNKTKFSKNIILLTGIADAEPLIQYINKNYKLIKHIAFKDHHIFTQRDIKNIVSSFHKSNYKNKCILTTEKDSGRILQSNLIPILQQLPVFLLPMSIEFIDEEELFSKVILDCVNK